MFYTDRLFPNGAFSVIVQSNIFVYSEAKLAEKGHFNDLQTDINLHMCRDEFVVKRGFLRVLWFHFFPRKCPLQLS